MVFCFVQNFFFSHNTRVRIFIFFVAQSVIFFFQNSTIGYMTKTLFKLNDRSPNPFRLNRVNSLFCLFSCIILLISFYLDGNPPIFEFYLF
jgi:uncharacterized membrane protein